MTPRGLLFQKAYAVIRLGGNEPANLGTRTSLQRMFGNVSHEAFAIGV